MNEFKWISSNEQLPEELQSGILIKVRDYCFIGTLGEIDDDGIYYWYCDANEEWEAIEVKDTCWSYIPINPDNE